MAGLSRPQKDRAIMRIEAKANDRARVIAEFIRLEANARAPVDENRPATHHGPRLKGSYYVKRAKGKNGWVVASTVGYWAFVEYGTGHFREPHDKNSQPGGFPHVRPAIEAARIVFGG